MKIPDKVSERKKRHLRIRQKAKGTAEKPRMSVRKSLKHMYVQMVDDVAGRTLLSASTLSKEFRDRFPDKKNNKVTAGHLGELAAEKAQEKGIKKIVFDRGGYKYHGRVKELAEAGRKKGLIF